MSVMKIKVTISVEEDVWRRFRAQSIQQGKNASSEIEVFMKSHLETQKPKKK